MITTVPVHDEAVRQFFFRTRRSAVQDPDSQPRCNGVRGVARWESCARANGHARRPSALDDRVELDGPLEELTRIWAISGNSKQALGLVERFTRGSEAYRRKIAFHQICAGRGWQA